MTKRVTKVAEDSIMENMTILNNSNFPNMVEKRPVVSLYLQMVRKIPVMAMIGMDNQASRSSDLGSPPRAYFGFNTR